jgi:diguanylate cyclase (GGDEF)-like protein/PAS domain S-box-containing protein
VRDDRDSVIETAMRALLAQNPDALVMAINEGGLFVPMPESVPLERHRVSQARSALDLVVSSDRVPVMETWAQAREDGGGRVVVHLPARPDVEVVMQFFDVRATHGVFIGTVLAEDADDLASVAEIQPMKPRFGVTRKSELAVLTAVDDATTKILGWTAEEMVGKRSLEIIHPDDHDRAINNWMEILSAGGHSQRVRLRHHSSDGSWVWLEITNINRLDDPDYGCVVAEILDISEEMAAHESVRASEQLLRRLAETIPVGLVQVDPNGAVVYANTRVQEIVGTGVVDTVAEQLATVAPSHREDLEAAIARVLADGEDVELDARFELGGGSERSCLLALRALTSDDGEVTGAIICVSDVTESGRMRAELERRATVDALTGCFNRASVMSALEAELVRPDQRTAAIFLDLDGFKDVNDELGHAAGDEVLTVVADRLRRSVRGQDIVGRLGGDEFLVLCPMLRSPADADAVADRIAATLDEELMVSGQAVSTRASIGVAYCDGATTADALIAEADAAMYKAKHGHDASPGRVA